PYPRAIQIVRCALGLFPQKKQRPPNERLGQKAGALFPNHVFRAHRAADGFAEQPRKPSERALARSLPSQPENEPNSGDDSEQNSSASHEGSEARHQRGLVPSK